VDGIRDGRVNVLDLFSGIGGFSLGLESTGHYRTIAFCEIEPFCQRVLRKHWPDVPIYGDIRELTRERLVSDGIIEDPQRIGCSHGGDDKNKSEVRGQREPSTGNGDGICIQPYAERTSIDFICGGFPCQPFSHAGKRKGTDDNRYLWPEMLRVIREVHPSWVLGENVAGIINMALEQVCADLEGEGYEVQPFIIPACAVNAPHRRDRIWIIAHSQNDGSRGITREICQSDGRQDDGLHVGTVNADCHVPNKQIITGWERPWLEVATRLCRVDDGVPNRVDRLKSLGNAVVPQIVAILGEAIWENQINCS